METIEGLTEEQQAVNFETMRHVEMVRNLLNKVIAELLVRGQKHDQSKLKSPEVELFTEYTKKLQHLTYGSEEYTQTLGAMGPALNHHYANNRHHPEWHRQSEQWKVIPKFDSYEVSNFGSLRTCVNKRVISSYATPKGYRRLQLVDNKEKKSFFVHRLVAKLFIPNPQNKPEVNHKDGQKCNNHVGNLEWTTSSENLQHAYEMGLKKPTRKYVVECSKLNIITFGCNDMESQLKAVGYKKARASAIWRCINQGGKHLDLEFIGSVFEEWMDSPMNGMNIVDLIEMLCDWKAASTRHNDGNLRKSIEINGNRFRMSPQLIKIFENSISLVEDTQ